MKVPIFGDLCNEIIITRFAVLLPACHAAAADVNAMTIVSKAAKVCRLKGYLISPRQQGEPYFGDPMEASGMFPPIIINGKYWRNRA
ncbi:MAG: hypothetical protein ACLR2G_02845 [Phascolarctobacterium faecium]